MSLKIKDIGAGVNESAQAPCFETDIINMDKINTEFKTDRSRT